MLAKWNPETVETIIAEKNKTKGQWMWNPDAPEDESAKMYRTKADDQRQDRSGGGPGVDEHAGGPAVRDAGGHGWTI
eukprot:10386446-Alexandrium_andersonii.AAC.1